MRWFPYLCGVVAVFATVLIGAAVRPHIQEGFKVGVIAWSFLIGAALGSVIERKP